MLRRVHSERDCAWVQVTVILEHMFTPAEFEGDPTLREELEDDITAECGKMGKVDKVIPVHHEICQHCQNTSKACANGLQNLIEPRGLPCQV